MNPSSKTSLQNRLHRRQRRDYPKLFHAYPETLKRNLPEGSERVISGKLESFNGSLQMSHPDYVGRPEEMDRIKTVEAVYPLTGGITNK